MRNPRPLASIAIAAGLAVAGPVSASQSPPPTVLLTLSCRTLEKTTVPQPVRLTFGPMDDAFISFGSGLPSITAPRLNATLFPLTLMEASPDHVTARFSVPGSPSHKLVLDRKTGRIEIKGDRFAFLGGCRSVTPPGIPF